MYNVKGTLSRSIVKLTSRLVRECREELKVLEDNEKAVSARLIRNMKNTRRITIKIQNSV